MARGCGCFIPLVMTVFGVGFGLQATYAWVTNPDPTVVPCGAMTSPPPAAWIAMERCVPDPRVAVFAPQGPPRRAWVALRPPEADLDDPARVVVDVLRDRELLRALSDADVGGEIPEALERSLGSASGQARAADSLGMGARRMFKERGVAIHDDVVIVRYGQRPNLIGAAAWWLLGVLGIAGMTMTVLSVVFPSRPPDP